MNMQLSLSTPTSNSWAFAVKRNTRPRLSLRSGDWSMRNFVISACSVEARRMGVRAGMHYQQAKKLIPDLRIILIGEGKR